MTPPESTLASAAPPRAGFGARSRLTLAQVFFVALAAATLLVGMLLYAAVAGSERVILQSSDTFRDTAARHVEELVQRELGIARDALEGVERRIHFGVVDPDASTAVEAVLFAELLDRPRLAEVTFTRATRLGFDGDGNTLLAPERWQISVFRPRAGDAAIVTRRTRSEAGRFVAAVRVRAPGAPLLGAEPVPAGEVPDPAAHLTFSVLASQAQRGRMVWSDLHYSELDLALPAAERRIVVTVQKAIEDEKGGLIGVLRVGLLTGELDAIVKLPVDQSDPHDPHRVFLCDERGRLITRLAPDDRIVLEGDDLRVVASSPPEPIAAALQSPLLAQLALGRDQVAGVVTASGRRHLVTFRVLRDTQGWNVGVIVPEERYTRTLEQTRRGVVAVYAVVSALMVAAGVIALRAIGRGLRGLVEATMRMRRFDFAPIPAGAATFREIGAVAENLERAKTVVRAMGKYVPMDLVRRLYEENRDPVLGGELRVVTMMFTDIEAFTSLSEKLPPDELANKLGPYLDTMTEAIRATEGTIDKYIGDAVMALWNAPGDVPGHPRAACRAALACLAATRALYASDAWRGLPALTTRYGLHTDEVMVGHFGAPARLSYTALGDGVNLAARLEPLCKQYGIILMVSEAVEAEAREEFELRRLDRVAVKGKTRGVVVYELLGARGAPGLPLAAARTYEKALDVYFERRFADAIMLLEAQLDDPPSKVLRDRCVRLSESPPPEGWDGVFVATSK
jgi:adenylate cyclase